MSYGVDRGWQSFSELFSSRGPKGLKIIELNLDDGIVFVEADDKFIENLRLIFQRFLKHIITLNPSKCVLGLTITRDKVDSVLNFPRSRLI